jgi:hypothetical protein
LTAGSQVLLPGYIRSAGLQLISDMTRWEYVRQPANAVMSIPFWIRKSLSNV